MKKFLLAFIGMFFVLTANAAEKEEYHLIKTESFLSGYLYAIGLPYYPPFSYYEKNDRGDLIFHSIFLEPLRKYAKKEGIKIRTQVVITGTVPLEKQILSIRSGESQLFLGAYSHTKLFNAIELVYPAVLSNPLHIITMPETHDRIKNVQDLKNLRGLRVKEEYFSDFAERKFQPLNLTVVDTPYEAYEQLFTGAADYIIGSMYYHRIMSSRLGIEQYLAFSQKPLLKIPLFVAMSKLTPLFSEYLRFFQDTMKDPEFGKAVKEEVLRVIEEEREKNAGVVPPAFFIKETEPQSEEEVIPAPGEEQKKSSGKVIEKEIKQKTIDEVLDGI